MALTYKTDQITLNAADTDFTILSASAASTLVKNITWIHADHGTTVILSLTKSGGTKTQIGSFTASANTATKIWTDILPLQANDVLHLQSNHISGTDVGYCVVSYVEDSNSVAGQSIGVHTDVDITGITNGQILKWNSTDTEFQPGDESVGLTDTDDLTEGTSNLYHTDARVDARIAAASVTDLSDVTSAGSGAIMTSAERTKLTGIATAATANDTDANLLNRSNHTGTQTASTISDFDNEVSNNTSVAANTAKNTYPSADAVKLAGIETGATANDTDANLLNRSNHTGTQLSTTISDLVTTIITRISLSSITDLTDTMVSLTANQILRVNPAGTSVITESKRKAFETNEIESDQNRIINADIGTASNKIVDIMNDALASNANANAKSFLGFYDGTNVVIDGMVDVGATIQGATAGGPLWLGTNGVFVASAPTTTDYYSRVVGYYIGAGQGSEIFVYFNPSRDWIQID
jgi:ribosomal silencing factor RsfS